MPTARVTRKMAETIGKEYLDFEENQELFQTKLVWGDELVFSIYYTNNYPGAMSLVKIRAGGKHKEERHEYYIVTNSVKLTEEILGTVCDRSMFKCLRWIP